MFDLVNILKTGGYVVIFGFVFAESGLLIGFFLPGDSLLFTAGLLASQGFFSLPVLLAGSFAAAVLGDSVGYAFGKKVGPAIFKKEDSLFFNKEHLERARVFYERHGGKTLILARFMPFVRTFAPILAGVGRMRYRSFLAYNVIGGFIWAIGLTVLGYYFGNVVPDIEKYIMPILGVIIIVSISPGIIHLFKDKNSRDKVRSVFSRKKVE